MPMIENTNQSKLVAIVLSDSYRTPSPQQPSDKSQAESSEDSEEPSTEDIPKRTRWPKFSDDVFDGTVEGF